MNPRLLYCESVERNIPELRFVRIYEKIWLMMRGHGVYAMRQLWFVGCSECVRVEGDGEEVCNLS